MLGVSLNQKGAIPKVLSAINPAFGATAGIIGKAVSSLRNKPVEQGNTPGMLNTGNVKSTTDSSGKTTVYDTKSNPSVLAQQKALNALGAGLVEDGIIGEKTRAAIAKYSTQSKTPTTPTTPVVEPPKPEPIDTQSNARRVLQTGQQQPIEQQATEKLYQAGQMTPEEIAANEEVRKANEIQKAYQNVSALAPYAEAGMFSDRARTPAEIQALIQSPDLAGRAGATQGLLGSLGDIYGSSRVAGANSALQGIQTAAQRGLSAAQTGIGSAQTTAGRGLEGATTVLGAGLPGQQGVSSTLYNPLEGAQGGTSVAQGANRQSVFDLTQQVNDIQSIFNGAEANFELLVNTALQGGVNDTTIPAINALQQAVSRGLASDSAVINFQNTLAAVRSQYAQILGGGTSTVDSQNRAEEAIPNDISIAALQSLEQQLKAEASNRVAGIQQQINSLEQQPVSQGSGDGWADIFGN